jgi:beta-galactosidase
MKTKLIFLVSSIVGLCFFMSCIPNKKSLGFERETSFNAGWKFVRSDISGAESAGFNDSSWRTIDLPHDWSIEDLPEKAGVKQIGPFSDESEGGGATAYVVGGTGWYRKHFKVFSKDKAKNFTILFDGVYMDADVWLNGNHLGNHPYGYTAFAYNLTPFLNPAGKDNVLSVRVRNEGKNSRWYSGSGIYRNVKLIKTNPVCVDLWGTYISTPDVTKEKAGIALKTNLVNNSKEEATVEVSVLILNPANEKVGETKTKTSILSGNNALVGFRIAIEKPELWSPEVPKLYTAIVQVAEKGKLVDKTQARFGIRSLDFSPGKGFLLNGEPVLLKGGCMHHDNGPLGSAAFKTAEYRRVKTMKENGFNAIRTSHNPPSKEFLDACDELGMFVLDEAFDQWQRPKNPMDYNRFFDNWWDKDLESMVLRDRNHPSIIVWSIGNEINERADSSGVEIAKRLKEKVLSMDKTRPVTQAVCNFWDHPGRAWDATAPAFSQMDVHGYNYQKGEYERDHELHPERIILGTESVAMEAFENWQMVEKYSYVIGDFVWTGMDYLGESGIGNSHTNDIKWGFMPPWPWYISNCGDISILGYKKPQSFFRDVVWQNSKLEMLVHAPVPDGKKEVVSYWGWPNELKSWNWAGSEGKLFTVSVYTRAEKVRLELNGKIIGEKEVSDSTKLTAKFEVPYQPGELVAVALSKGQEVARQSLKTTGKSASLRIKPEQDKIPASPENLAYFNIEVVDENGQTVPDASPAINFKIGRGYKLQAVANGKPDEMQSFQKPEIKSWQGRCQLIVRSSDKAGKITVEATSPGLKSATAEVSVVKNQL